jgi:hypothetical protein
MELRDTARAADGYELGHSLGGQPFGYFAPESREDLWRDTLSWLRAKAAR